MDQYIVENHENGGDLLPIISYRLAKLFIIKINRIEY